MSYWDRQEALAGEMLARPLQLDRCQTWSPLLSLVGKTAHLNFTLNPARRSQETPGPLSKLALVWLGNSFLLILPACLLVWYLGTDPKDPGDWSILGMASAELGREKPSLSPPDPGPFMEEYCVIYSPFSLETEERKRDWILTERIQAKQKNSLTNRIKDFRMGLLLSSEIFLLPVVG